ncbi:Cupredoxin [Cantharellus anzutake]|uniref:Cupredoxin n=1 Tax=Cantharellus anzutake TaxID=1750568 RepID=UPI001906219C|nr:Cupredoxin [Cantharellus anzutake]KAF8326083.1 Cupredoxin [Cantharellus anzutake]
MPWEEGFSDTGTGRRSIRKTCSVLIFIVVFFALVLHIHFGTGFGLRHDWTTTDTRDGDEMSGNDQHGHNGPSKKPDLSRDDGRFLLDAAWNYTAPPTIRVYHWTISEVLASPGAMPKPVLVVNGQSPGPTIRANLGDRIIVKVKNLLRNVTAIHWHGLYQNGTNYFDGTYAITQCGIPANGGTFTYSFIVQNVGTYWWHAHYSTQSTDGLYGALILHSPHEIFRRAVHYDQDVVVMIGDYYSTYSEILLKRFLRYGTGIDGQPGDEPSPDGGVINGISQARCAYIPATDLTLPERRSGGFLSSVDGDASRSPPGQLEQPVINEINDCASNADINYPILPLEGGKSYRFRVINVGSLTSMAFSIDKHSMSIVEADGVDVEPRITERLVVGIAQRYSAVVSLDRKASAYWIRAVMETNSLRYNNPNLNLTTLGILRYDGVAAGTKPPETPAPLSPRSLSDDKDFVPAGRLDAPKATKVVSVTVSMQYDVNGDYRSFFNNTSWEPLTSTSTLLEISRVANSLSYHHPDQLLVSTRGVETIDLIVNSLDDGDHPFHLHGHTFFIVGWGAGRYIGQALSHISPMRRDTVIIPKYSWMALRFTADNPGVWAFHCHISWHAEAGLVMQFANLANQRHLSIPPDVEALCRND